MPRRRKAKPAPESPRLPRSFDLFDLAQRYRSTSRPIGLYAWEHEAIMSARDDQVRGKFKRPVALVRSMLTERAIYAAAVNRLAPHRGLPRSVSAPMGVELAGNALSVLEEAAQVFGARGSVAVTAGVHADAFSGKAFLGLHIEQVVWEPRADGSREDPFVTPWPMEFAEWSEVDRCLIATTTEGRVPIVHGDGRWIVTQEHELDPWQWGAVVPFAALWPETAFGRRDRSANAESHGDSKFIGYLPEGIDINSPQGDAMLAQMERLYDTRRVMLAPSGAKVERNEAMSANWQIFKEIIDSNTRDAQRILLGQDGTMSDSGGNYIKSRTLFGVRNDIVEGDLVARGAALSSGLLRPWSLVNFGRWDRLEFSWTIPDADEDARIESIAARTRQFSEALRLYRENGFVIDQPAVERLAREFRIAAPRLADQSPTGADFYAYELEGGVFTINEARERKGLSPVPWGNLTLPEARAQAEAAAAQPAAPAASDRTTSVTPHRSPLRPAS
jgi:hypothetical protein